MKALVVPSNREHGIKEFLKAWSNSGGWDEIIVVEDNPKKTFDLGVKHHYSWEEIGEDLGEDSWIISKRDSAIRCYGFLVAYRLGAEYIFSLDDDCYPHDKCWCDFHIRRMENTPRWTNSVMGQRTRGMPYENVGVLPDVVFNVGLWTGVADLDSIQSFAEKNPYDCDHFTPAESDRIIPAGQYFPFCGMNFAFHRKATPLCYFPLMGEGSPFGRFDDIWFGVIAKKICDHLGWHISVGRPYVHHIRQSDRFNNLVKEAPGIKFNEEFWEIIDAIKLTADNPLDCMYEVSNSLDHKSLYVPQLGFAIQTWATIFDKINSSR